jgi:hypothetical protein
VRSVTPVAVAIPTISCAAVSTLAAGAAPAGNDPVRSSNRITKTAIRRSRVFPKSGISTGYRLTSIEASAAVALAITDDAER